MEVNQVAHAIIVNPELTDEQKIAQLSGVEGLRDVINDIYVVQDEVGMANRTLLSEGVIHCSLDVVQHLVGTLRASVAQISDAPDPLRYAIYNNKKEIAFYLMEQGARFPENFSSDIWQNKILNDVLDAKQMMLCLDAGARVTVPVVRKMLEVDMINLIAGVPIRDQNQRRRSIDNILYLLNQEPFNSSHQAEKETLRRIRTGLGQDTGLTR